MVRMQGTNVELGKKILADSGLAIIPAETMAEAAEKIVAAVKELEDRKHKDIEYRIFLSILNSKMIDAW